MSEPDRTRHQRRFHRQISRLERGVPVLGGALRAISAPGRAVIRLPVAVLFILGGFVGFLPIVGFWMLPLGLLLLAIDLPRLRPFVATLSVRLRAWLRRWRR
jgi:hypothetical protein